MYGLTQRVLLDAAAPRGSRGGLLPGTVFGFERDGTAEADAPAGHVALAVSVPAVGWSAGVYATGQIYWRAEHYYETRRVHYIQPGRTVTGFVVRAAGVPMLRAALLQPYAPPPRANDDGGLVDGQYEPGTWKGARLATVVPGPGLPPSLITRAVVREQLEMACGAGLIAPGSCGSLRAEFRGTHPLTPPDAARLVALLAGGRPGRAAHPSVVLTLTRQIESLAAAALSRAPRTPATPR